MQLDIKEMCPLGTKEIISIHALLVCIKQVH